MNALCRARRPLGLLLALLIATPALAAGTAVFPPRRTNVEEGPMEALALLLANEYARASGQPVVLPAQAGAAVQPGMSLSAAAEALQVDEYLETSVIGLEEGMLVTTTRNRRDGTPVYSAQMRAESERDLPEVATRLARALFQQVPPERTRTLDTITEREAREPNRLATEKIMGFKTFASAPLGSTFEPLLGVGFDGRLESERFFLEFGAGFVIPTDNSSSRTGYGGLYAEFGANYYLAASNISPYVGAGVSPRLLFGSNIDSPANVAAWGQFGLMFLRTSSTRLYTDLRLTQNVFGLEIEGGERRYPTELGIQVGIGW